ncbi:MAG: glycosyltransferase, partial [Dissulfurimicrobium sp.]|uniref:glycosyltransferase n=1 Tax=Dissulfurimicrobium sp. TaxID=2022436 RepID=UPI00404B0109
FWLEGISDEYLEKVYAASTCLIMASEGEGFGLPLIEAARYKLPIVARDIPVFREVAGEYAYYFENSRDPRVMVDAIKSWLVLYKENKHPKSDNMPCLTWKESTENLLKIILNDNWTYKVLSDGSLRLNTIYNHKAFRLNWGRGWSEPEDNFRWTNGKDAELIFSLNDNVLSNAKEMRLLFNTLGEQHISVSLNGKLLFDGSVYGENREIAFQHCDFRKGENKLFFLLPDARQPDNGDKRYLAIAFKELEIKS